jgi:hypothetical protein
MEEGRLSDYAGGFVKGGIMSSSRPFPPFDETFSDLNGFLRRLVNNYEAGEIRSWDELEGQVKAYFTSEKMEQMELAVPGWHRMASFTDGITLVHVMCVFLGMLMLPEFQALTAERKQLAKWIILLHDIAKFHIRGKRDTMHAFRSGVQAANLLPRYGFATREHYDERIGYWSQYTHQAFIPGDGIAPKPDNQKLPYILIGIDNLFGKDTPAALITKTVLLHISLDVDHLYPTPAALNEEEIKRFISPNLLPLLKVMMLSDNEGWSLFDPDTRARQRKEALDAFQRVETIIFS